MPTTLNIDHEVEYPVICHSWWQHSAHIFVNTEWIYQRPTLLNVGGDSSLVHYWFYSNQINCWLFRSSSPFREWKCLNINSVFFIPTIMDWTQHKPIADKLWVTYLEHSWTLLKSQKGISCHFGHVKKTPNTEEINTRRKSERPKKQRKAKEIVGEGCGGLDGCKCLEIGKNSRRSVDV